MRQMYLFSLTFMRQVIFIQTFDTYVTSAVSSAILTSMREIAGLVHGLHACMDEQQY